jgi:transcriptional regulator GlxA family with amidase domain
VREHLERATGPKPTLDSIARSVGCPVRRVTDAFRQRFGVSVHAYLTRRRLTEAVRLLTQTDMKVWVVAASVGFRDKTALHRQFRRAFQTTPQSVRGRPQRGELLLERLRLIPDQARAMSRKQVEVGLT